MKIAVLGPEGSFSEEAARSYCKGKDEIIFYKFLEDLFKAVTKQEVDEAIVPVENSFHGSVLETLDLLYEYETVKIKKELIINIRHCLASKSKNFKIILSHPQAIAQCRNYLKKNYPNLKIIETTSTSEAMKLASKNLEYAAIGTREAAKKYGLNIIADNIGPAYNKTRFFVIARQDSENIENAKTSIAVYSAVDRPGLLFDILTPFKKYNINLTKIESRPTKKRIGEYIFYIDFIGHRKEKKIKRVLTRVKKIVTELKIFGSYERAY